MQRGEYSPSSSIRQRIPRVSLLECSPSQHIAIQEMSSFASGSNPSSRLTPMILNPSNDQLASKTQESDDHESRRSLKSLSSAASGLKAMFLPRSSGANSRRAEHNSKGNREKKRFYKLAPMSELVAESPLTENSPTKPITVTLRYAIVEGKPVQIRLAITCQITKSDGKYAQFTNPYLDTLDNLKVSIQQPSGQNFSIGSRTTTILTKQRESSSTSSSRGCSDRRHVIPFP